MNARPIRRRLPLAVGVLLALASVFAMVALAGGRDDRREGMSMHHSTAPTTVTAKQAAFDQAMRKLWEDHVTWTRLAVVSLTTGSPDTNATVARLLRNQADIGNAVKPYYGKAAGAALTGLLRQHILIAADLIKAAKSGDQEAVSAQQARWLANADAIAAFLNKANPRFWKLGEMKSMMHAHLGLTTAEVVDRLQGKWAADVAAYDRIHVQILEMADMLASGIEKQFPGRFQ